MVYWPLIRFPLQAINFLHECGVLLHYNDVQTKLSDLYFLDPEWLCMLMGQIITIKQVNAFTKDGVSLTIIYNYWISLHV
jgi:leucine-rich repeat kinase 2